MDFQLLFILQSGATRSWSWHQKYERESWFILMFMLQADATTSWSWHQKYEREGSIISMSVLQSSTELAHAGYIYIYIYIYSVLCASHCVVFYNVPPLMGQVLGKVLLTS